MSNSIVVSRVNVNDICIFYLKNITPKIAIAIPIDEIRNPIESVFAQLYFSLSICKVY